MNRAGVIGLGYVGLPLAVELCRSGYKVIGVDLDPDKIEALEAGRSYIDDVPSETIRELVDAGKFRPTSDYAPLSDVDAISICVPTPLRKTREPDISIVADVAESISKILRPGQTIVLESTVFPGATEEVVAPILMKSGLTPGEDFLLAFSPERIDPGNQEIAVRDIPKLVGGINERSTEAAAEYYRPVFSTVISMGSAKEAEMAKLLENTFRAVNIGLVNELVILANQMGLNLWNVIDAAATKPFGFMPFYPGP
ncbi:MAG: nucleotide sugar dehydrogenase, partial [Chloroflexi bacterium]|nr:nucleotide sugar dehydrogenase [Chloroflexota bacterium]